MCIIELQSRRVQVVGATPYPDEAFVLQAMRHFTAGTDGLLGQGRVLICDRDPKWSAAVVAFLEREGVWIIRTPARAPNCNAYEERFVPRSKKSASIARSSLSSVTSDAPSRSSSCTTTPNGTTRVSTTS